MTGRQVEAALGELRAHPQNYNKHSEAQIGRLMQSLETFGQPKPIVVWRGLIIAGHGLAEAAKRLKWQTLLASDVSEEWTEAQATAFVGADNELARLADPDEAALAALVASLKDVDAELASLAAGSDERLKELLASLEDGQAGDDPGAQIDKAEELRVKWGVETGQLWALGEHRLICGDCTDAAVVARVMGGEKAQACMTDPPWNIDWKYIGNTDDKLTPNQYKAMIDAWLSLAELHSLPGSFFFVWQAMKWCKYYSFFFDRDYRIMAICQNWVQFLPTAVQYAFDPVLFWVHEGKTLIEPQAGRRDYFISSTAGGRNTDDLTRLHTASRPLDAVEYVIDNFSISGAIVYEPFCGSGSVIIACERLNRRCRAVEIAPGYVAVALERWSVMTGQTPVLVDGATDVGNG